VKVLVTGARSCYGAAVARALAARGDEVTVFQREPAGLPVSEVLGDITRPASIGVATLGMDAVIHLAAKVSVVGAWDDFERTNVEGTRNVLEAARRAGVQRFVHVSTPSVAHHGDALVGVGAQPADPDRARGSYARSKAMAERLVLDLADEFAVVALRPHLVWGPGDTQLVGRVIERARRGRLALVGAGTALIDTTYLDNAVDATLAALDRAEEVHGRAFVVSNGEPRPVREILTRLCEAAEVPPPTRRVPFRVAHTGGAIAERLWRVLGRTDDPPMTAFLAEQLATAHWFDQRETRDALGWTPAVSLDEGFERLAAALRDGA
jgi:2-alkyl-3-oxoalkanoate reductase